MEAWKTGTLDTIGIKSHLGQYCCRWGGHGVNVIMEYPMNIYQEKSTNPQDVPKATFYAVNIAKLQKDDFIVVHGDDNPLPFWVGSIIEIKKSRDFCEVQWY